MSNSCKHKRVANLFFKHNDLAVLEVPHLKIEHDGYLPYIGILGGDDTNLTICLDCGQVIGWEPIPDAQIKQALNQQDQDGDDEPVVVEDQRPNIVGSNPRVEQARTKPRDSLRSWCKRHSCGILSEVGASASDIRDFLEEIATFGSTHHTRIAAQELLRELS